MIEQLQDFPPDVLAFAGSGRITRDDYEGVLLPAVERAFAERPRNRLYYQINPDVENIEPGAVWDDFLVGFQHLSAWERIAVVTDVDWIKQAVQFFGFVLPAPVRIFPLEGADLAREWITSAEAP